MPCLSVLFHFLFSINSDKPSNTLFNHFFLLWCLQMSPLLTWSIQCLQRTLQHHLLQCHKINPNLDKKEIIAVPYDSTKKLNWPRIVSRPLSRFNKVKLTLHNNQHKHLTFLQHTPQVEQSLNISSMLFKDFQKKKKTCRYIGNQN